MRDDASYPEAELVRIASRQERPTEPEPAEAAEEQLKVLIVDDEPSVLRNLSEGLSLLGFENYVANSSAAALETLERDPSIGVVVTDIRMPGRDGFSLARDVLSTRRLSAPAQVILITGHATIEDATAALRAGVRDLLRKPFRLAEAGSAVAAALQAALDERRALRERAAEARRIAELEATRADLAQRLQAALVQLSEQANSRAPWRPEYAAAISHALRTPLTAICGGTEIISLDAARFLQAGIEYVQAGLQDAIRSIELVEELCRVDRAIDSTSTEVLDVRMLAARAVSAAAAKASTRSVPLTMENDAEALSITGHRATVESILSHGLAAAVGAAPAGASISIAVAPAAVGGRDWAVTTLLAALPGSDVHLPPGLELVATASPLARTQEDLHFVIAARLAARMGGIVSSWNEGSHAFAIRIALPG